MILVTGIVLAVMFVTLGVLLNAAIYADNVATRGEDPAGEALEYQNGVVDSTEGLIEAENDAGNATADEVRPALENIGEYHHRYHLRRGAATNTTFDIYEGRNVTETDTKGFADWTVNADNIRGFVVDIDRSNMTKEDAPFDVTLAGDSFSINETGSELVIKDGSGNSCQSSGSPVRFNVTALSLDGKSCPFDAPSLVGGGDVGINRGSNGAGSYEALIESDADTSGLPPDTATFIYRVELTLRVDTPELRYQRTAEVVSEVPDVT